MEENKNTNAAEAAETAAEAIKKLLAAIGNDDELKRKLEDALAGLTGKSAETGEPAEDESRPDPEKGSTSRDEPESAAEEIDDDDGDTEFSSGEDFSDIFTEDALAGMVVGFVVGAAAVGGGVLIHKLISRD